MSLIGMPLTPGFRGHWLTVDMASSESFWLAALMVLSIAAGVIALLRLGAKSLRSEPGDEIPHRTTSTAMRWAGAVVLLMALLLASYPQLMSDVAQRMAQLF
jgi:NADH:ubiquinone oxidoreductase subunit 2 (subunit N)